MKMNDLGENQGEGCGDFSITEAVKGSSDAINSGLMEESEGEFREGKNTE